MAWRRRQLVCKSRTWAYGFIPRRPRLLITHTTVSLKRRAAPSPVNSSELSSSRR